MGYHVGSDQVKYGCSLNILGSVETPEGTPRCGPAPAEEAQPHSGWIDNLAPESYKTAPLFCLHLISAC